MFANTEKMRKILSHTDAIHDDLEQTGGIIQDMKQSSIKQKLLGKSKYKTEKEKQPEDPEAR